MLMRDHHAGSRNGWTLSVYTLFATTIIFLTSSGCSLLRPRETVRVQHDTLQVHHRDSIHLRDSIYIREWVRGDTVFVDRWHDRVYYRDRWRDSIRVQHDTTAVYRTKEVKVEQPLRGWRRFRIGAFWWLLALAAVGWRKELLWLIKKAVALFV